MEVEVDAVQRVPLDARIAIRGATQPQHGSDPGDACHGQGHDPADHGPTAPALQDAVGWGAQDRGCARSGEAPGLQGQRARLHLSDGAQHRWPGHRDDPTSAAQQAALRVEATCALSSGDLVGAFGEAGDHGHGVVDDEGRTCGEPVVLQAAHKVGGRGGAIEEDGRTGHGQDSQPRPRPRATAPSASVPATRRAG